MSFILFCVAMDVFVFGRGKSSSWEKRKVKEIMKQMDEDNK